MPEGPEIRRAADTIAAVMVDQPLETVWFEFPHLYGRWYVTTGETPKVTRSLRVELRHNEGAAFLYSATDIDVLTSAELAQHPFLTRLGPDVLTASIDDLEQVLLSSAFAGRALGGLYLDQGFVAGLGNYLRSEILFYAGVHPSKKPRQLKGQQRRKLARLTREISRRSYKTRGVTLSPSHAKTLKNGVSFERRRFAVFGREGRACYNCGCKIERISVASRRLYYCPSCQSK